MSLAKPPCALAPANNKFKHDVLHAPPIAETSLRFLQGWTLLLIGPLLDRHISGAWVFNYQYNGAAIVVLLVSCSMAVLVNISQFMCLGRFSAVTYQVSALDFCLHELLQTDPLPSNDKLLQHANYNGAEAALSGGG